MKGSCTLFSTQQSIAQGASTQALLSGTGQVHGGEYGVDNALKPLCNVSADGELGKVLGSGQGAVPGSYMKMDGRG